MIKWSNRVLQLWALIYNEVKISCGQIMDLRQTLLRLDIPHCNVKIPLINPVSVSVCLWHTLCVPLRWWHIPDLHLFHECKEGGGLPDGSRGRGRPQENQVIPLLQFTHNIKAIKVNIFSFRMSSENNHFSREDGDFERKYKAGPINHRFDGRSSCCLSKCPHTCVSLKLNCWECSLSTAIGDG